MFLAEKKQQKSGLSLDRKGPHFPHQMQQLLPDLCNTDHKHFLSSSCDFEVQQLLSRSTLKDVQRGLARGRYRGFVRKTWWNSTMVLIILIFLRCKMTQRGKLHFQILGHDNFYFLFSLSFFLFFSFFQPLEVNICVSSSLCNNFWFCFHSRMKSLVQLVHSLKTRMESPDYEMVGD